VQNGFEALNQSLRIKKQASTINRNKIYKTNLQHLCVFRLLFHNTVIFQISVLRKFYLPAKKKTKEFFIML